MRTPPFVVEVPSNRYFIDDHCANCLEPLPEDVEALLLVVCAEIADAVRYQRRVTRDGRIDDPLVQDAVEIRNAFLLAGGYRALGRTMSLTTRVEVKTRDGGKCQVCGKPGTEIDHIDGSSGDQLDSALTSARNSAVGTPRAKPLRRLPTSTVSRSMPC